MATKLLFQKWEPNASTAHHFKGHASVIVEHCPFFASYEQNPEVLRLQAEGYQYSGHIDGVIPPSQEGN